MSGVWIKIAIFAVLVVGVIVGISMLSPGQKPPPQGPQTYGEQVAEDRAKFAIDYENQSLPPQPARPAPQEPSEQPQTPPPAAQPSPATQPPALQQPAPQPLKFVELEVEDQVAAERLYEMAMRERSMGRLPGVGKYTRMVQYCRQVIKQYPGTVYAYRAKQMMADIPRDYQEQMGVTAEELDLSEFRE
jgi:type IV secretory pathway VirB10-like protein